MNIKTVIALPVAFTLGMLAALVLLAYSPAPASAHEGEQHSNSEEKQEDSKSETSSYDYVAQVGDSYTAIARKAIQTYGIQRDINLSQNRIVYAETSLTQDAGSPSLNIGQKVSISEEKLKTWVEKAQSLSEKKASLWDVYVPLVDFNTDNVGESR